ncbi:MAG: bifunctional phosphoglucose/phosphomannose isomerase [Anaerolineae bacterium]
MPDLHAFGPNLDDLAAMQALDPGGMLQQIRHLPDQCRAAWGDLEGWDLPQGHRNPRAVAIAGMGGSAIGGDLLRTWAEPVAPAPIVVVRDYRLPAWVDPKALLVASSYSGDTEETLAAFQEAIQRGARVVALTTGGRLAEWAEARGIPLVRMRHRSVPRAALGASLVSLLGITHRAGLVPDPRPDLDEALAEMERLREEVDATVPEERNSAKRLARALHGRPVLVCGAEHLREVARRWKGQCNENAKAWAFHEEIPELHHNSILAYEGQPTVNRLMAVVLLTSPNYHPRNALRLQATEALLERYGVAHVLVEARGTSRLAQMLTALYFGDYVSFYLAVLYGQDPTAMGTITYLKEVLARV